MKQTRLVLLAIIVVGVPVYGYFFAQANRSVVALDLLATRVSELSLWLVVWGSFTAVLLAALMAILIKEAAKNGANKAFFLTAHPAPKLIAKQLGFTATACSDITYRRVLGFTQRNMASLSQLSKSAPRGPGE